MKLLDSELRHLKATGVVMLMALADYEIRNDGRPRADAKPRHPGVILSFTTPNGAMQFPCDRFDYWADNIRAIALGLEALRKVERYGIAPRSEQYTGWKALPAPASTPTQTKQQALESLRRFISGRVDTLPVDAAIRECEMLTHPDRGGKAEDFKQVQEARKVLLA